MTSVIIPGIPEGITGGFFVGVAVGLKLGDIVGIAKDTTVGRTLRTILEYPDGDIVG